MKTFAFAAAAAACLLFAGTAQAVVTDDTNLGGAGVYFGSGNSDGHFETNYDPATGIQIGLRSRIYQSTQPIPTGNVYQFSLGDIAGIDYSYNPSFAGNLSTFVGTALLTVTNLGNGQSVSFDPSLVPDNAHSSSAVGGYQNSERLNFAFFNGLGFNPNQDSTLQATFTFTPTNGSRNLGLPMSVSNLLVFGAGAPGAVPEPSTWAMMIMGFGGAGAALRSRRRRVAFA